MTSRKKLIVAVSGGVDSVVLLDVLSRTATVDVIVAHFDHGIRPDSQEDAAFVRKLAAQYQLPFETRREALGSQASEELARSRRYAFLRRLANDEHAVIATGHHGDDVIESIVINATRGTGWRGLAVLDSDIYRPLLTLFKEDVIAYARQHNLAWREDSTNASDHYLRNRVRRKTAHIDRATKRKLLQIWGEQRIRKHKIDREVARLISRGDRQSRYFFTMIDTASALECLRALSRGQLTRPQLERALLAIKTATPGKVYQAGSGIELDFTPRHFSLRMIK